ncbi:MULTISPECIES: hypothetical protein [Sphingobacterium]|uniref:hypothetical protein n=1 Tax=Sphingobacterium TaxID=28453 RepID=UPI001050308B|nr:MULTISPECIES: hypothetical protein [Sphingobacterium]MCW2262085.1 putative lipoprotein [Sphingobacterium kitahiroshimense]TCR13168.1 hypothetical protein EDF67_102582 [Sphingobacterium sp. JUb78]
MSFVAFSKNSLKVRIEYGDTGEAFVAADHQKTIAHLTEKEKLLGKWSPKVSCLQIISLSKTLDYENPETKD